MLHGRVEDLVKHDGRHDLGRVLQVLAHLLGERAEANGGEEVDGEARVARIVARKEALKELGERGIVEALAYLHNAHVLAEVEQQVLEVDARRRGRLVLVQVHALEHAPRYRVCVEQMRQEARHVAQLDRLEAVARLVLLLEDLLVGLDELLLELAEALRQQAEEALVRALLCARVQYHLTELALLILLDVHLEQLVSALLEVQRRLDGQVDGATQRHQVRLRLVDDQLVRRR